ncbi:MAG: indolepyruvate oxidoreductase subunit beta [Spirochaetaceae bacterium]|jgi:indolepyruvate ferredoxin oxidoreductase beta subunit|nr:indolepyruvate oxidoreductase subunit beta [Spirochaetaceae bacterium]
MKKDIILSGVGGQGVLSIAAIIAQAALSGGFTVRQSEVHGMAQRGGAVLAHLRVSDQDIAGDLVPQGSADLIVSMELLESLRYAAWLSPEGALVTAAETLVNIPDYPDAEELKKTVLAFPRHCILEAERLAREAGLSKAVNMVMVGAASTFLPLDSGEIEKVIERMFFAKGASVCGANLRAYALGRENGSRQ